MGSESREPLKAPGLGELRMLLLGGGFLLLVVVVLAWRPLAGVGLAALGIVWLVFRLIDLDATTVLTVYVVLLTMIPATDVLPAMGAFGTPAGVFALGCAYWWALEHTAPRSERDTSRGMLQPVRVGLTIFLLTSAMGFVVAFARPLSSIETNGAARALLGVVGLVGVALLAADGITSRARFDVLLNRVLNLAALMSVIACFQFFTDFDPVSRWRLPFLVPNQDLASVVERSVVNRVSSTTLHPIEFGAIVAILLPLAFHTALYAEPGRRTRRWVRVGLLAFALPLSVSRTAVVVAAVVLLMIWPAWSWSRRWRVLAAAAVFAVVMRSMVPGLLGTITALFTSFNEDPSTSGRTEDYSRVWELFVERPVFGRGLGTFDPILYFFLDNQVLMTVVTGGIVGLVGLIGLVVVATTMARQVFWHGPDEEAQHLGAALAASIVGGFFGFLTFDALGFPVFAGLMFILIGLAGAAWRLEVAPFGRRYTNARSRSHDLGALDGSEGSDDTGAPVVTEHATPSGARG